ncbi:MAG: FAD-dependent oxidoreductase, partial [Pseudomonadota bacterium]
KPVVGVGRLGSPDMMVGMIGRGVLDLIGAARPSIADPFLPRKIEEGRVDEIRECIGCNICVMSDSLGVAIRCTQNPTMGEEWRRGWHPERIAPVAGAPDVLVIGAGPAGLECALQLARRGCHVTLAEAQVQPGGRVRKESALPGLGAWGRVADYRLNELRQRANVDMFFDSALTPEDVTELGIEHVFVATGAMWRSDGIGRNTQRTPPVIAPDAVVLSPDDVMSGIAPPAGHVLVYDDDQGYLAGVLAEKLVTDGHTVTFVTPASVVSPFTDLTLEQHRVQARLIELGVDILCCHVLTAVQNGEVRLQCVYSARERRVGCASALLVTERTRRTRLYDALRDTGLVTLELAGDAAGPGLIADAVFAGHMAARNFARSADDVDAEWYRREIISLSNGDQP